MRAIRKCYYLFLVIVTNGLINVLHFCSTFNSAFFPRKPDRSNNRRRELTNNRLRFHPNWRDIFNEDYADKRSEKTFSLTCLLKKLVLITILLPGLLFVILYKIVESFDLNIGAFTRDGFTYLCSFRRCARTYEFNELDKIATVMCSVVTYSFVLTLFMF